MLLHSTYHSEYRCMCDPVCLTTQCSDQCEFCVGEALILVESVHESWLGEAEKTMTT